MEAAEARAVSSISTALHESTLVSLGAADNQAQKAARLQQQNRPWMCSKLKMIVTNDQCRDSHARAEVRQCRDCGIPNILPKQEGQEMAKKRFTCPKCGNYCACLYGKSRECWSCYNAEKVDPVVVVPVSNEVAAEQPKTVLVGENGPEVSAQEKKFSEPTIKVNVDADEAMATMEKLAAKAVALKEEPSWDDFKPFTAPAIRFGGMFCQISAKDIRMSAEAAAAADYKEGQHVEIAHRDDPAGLAMRTVGTASYHTRKVSKPKVGAQVQISIQPIIKKFNIQKGKYPVTVTSWGIIVHLDRVIGAKP